MIPISIGARIIPGNSLRIGLLPKRYKCPSKSIISPKYIKRQVNIAPAVGNAIENTDFCPIKKEDMKHPVVTPMTVKNKAIKKAEMGETIISPFL